MDTDLAVRLAMLAAFSAGVAWRKKRGCGMTRQREMSQSTVNAQKMLIKSAKNV